MLPDPPGGVNPLFKKILDPPLQTPLNTNVYPACDGHQLRHVIRFCSSTRFMVRPCDKASGNNCGNRKYFILWDIVNPQLGSGLGLGLGLGLGSG